MSFDLYLQIFSEGELACISRELLRTAFGPYLTEAGLDYWQLCYGDANTCEIDLTTQAADASMVHALTIHRPCADPRLWDALASILKLSNVVLYFPGGRAPLVARSSVAEHLPPDMVKALGQPVIVMSGREIQNELQDA